ncbi:hypothetical protein EF294_17455 [Gordonia oryzae]|uniref:Transposase IS204/IS1001/IS1096/IS1165 DDE domain-containing protein n=1 Tax=Gordonia oryzae TaxID=2487349 RepID=A0A3N4GGY0_9ACTN|nr:hypothetical protein [Gordonia oryzae]RPA57860.1 hypothetical protein EF294_17455 [Gordonia oryzae]
MSWCRGWAAHRPIAAVTEFMRVARRTVARVVDEHLAGVDRFDGLIKIGIDEIAHRKGHRYLSERVRAIASASGVLRALLLGEIGVGR